MTHLRSSHAWSIAEGTLVFPFGSDIALWAFLEKHAAATCIELGTELLASLSKLTSDALTFSLLKCMPLGSVRAAWRITKRHRNTSCCSDSTAGSELVAAPLARCFRSSFKLESSIIISLVTAWSPNSFVHLRSLKIVYILISA